MWRPVLIVRSLNPIALPPEFLANIPVGVIVVDAIVIVTAPSFYSSQPTIVGSIGSTVLTVIDLVRSEERIVLALFPPVTHNQPLTRAIAKMVWKKS